MSPQIKPAPMEKCAKFGFILSLCGIFTCGWASLIGILLSGFGIFRARKYGKRGTALGIAGIIIGLIIYIPISILFFTAYHEQTHHIEPIDGISQAIADTCDPHVLRLSYIGRSDETRSYHVRIENPNLEDIGTMLRDMIIACDGQIRSGEYSDTQITIYVECRSDSPYRSCGLPVVMITNLADEDEFPADHIRVMEVNTLDSGSYRYDASADYEIEHSEYWSFCDDLEIDDLNTHLLGSSMSPY